MQRAFPVANAPALTAKDLIQPRGLELSPEPITAWQVAGMEDGEPCQPKDCQVAALGAMPRRALDNSVPGQELVKVAKCCPRHVGDCVQVDAGEQQACSRQIAQCNARFLT